MPMGMGELSEEDIKMLYGAAPARKPAGPSDEELKEQYLKEMYEAEMAEGAEKEGGTFIIDEMHPALTNMQGLVTRAKFKNLSPNSDVGFNFLQQEYPDMDWKTDSEGNVIVKAPTEKAWRRLDPSSFEASDVSDILSDVGMGVAETVGSVAGGIAGGFAGLAGGPAAPVTVPGGALAGAATGGAVAGAGSEALRQKMGQWMGMPTTELDPEALKTSAMWGAASPLMFGTGAVTKHALKAGSKGIGKELLERGARKFGSKELAQEAVMKGQSGLIGKGFRGAKGLLPTIGEVASGYDKDLIKWANKNLDKIEAAEMSPTGREDLITELRDTMIAKFEQERKEVGAQIGNVLKSEGRQALPVRETMKPFDELVAKYQKTYDAKPTQKALEDLDFSKQVRDKLFKVGDEAAPTNIVDIHGKPLTIDEYVEVLDSDSSISLLNDLNDYTNIRKPQMPGMDVRSSRMTDVERDLQRAARIAASRLDGTIKAAIGTHYGTLKSRYKKVVDVGQTINQFFKTPEKTEATMSLFFNPKKNVQRTRLINSARLLGDDIVERAKEIAAIGAFAKPSTDVQEFSIRNMAQRAPASAMGTALGFWGGSAATGSYAPALALGVAGGAAASRMASPQAIRAYMGANRAMAKPWRAMQQQQVPLGPYAPAAPQTLLNIYEETQQNRR